MQWAQKQPSVKKYELNAAITLGFYPPEKIESELGYDIKHLSILGRFIPSAH